MQYALLTIVSLLAYIGGLVILLRATPRLCFHSFDEGLFMGIAALAVVGALLALGAFIVTYSLFSGNLPIKVLNFFMLVGVLVVGVRLALASFRPRVVTGTFEASRIMAGGYGVLLVLAALYCIVLLFLG
jgi:hypothetical protein